MANISDIHDEVEKRLQAKQANKEFKDVGRVSHTRKEKAAYKLISQEMLDALEEDSVMAFNMVKKENVWPEIDVADEKQRGVSAGAAYLKVKLRAAVPSKPKVNDKLARAIYVNFLTRYQLDLKGCLNVGDIAALHNSYGKLKSDEVIFWFISPEYFKASDEEKPALMKEILAFNPKLWATFYNDKTDTPIFGTRRLIEQIFGSEFFNIFYSVDGTSGRVRWEESFAKEPVTEEVSAKKIESYKENEYNELKYQKANVEKYKSASVSVLTTSLLKEWRGGSSSWYAAQRNDPEAFRKWAIDYAQKKIAEIETRYAKLIQEAQPHDNDWSWFEKTGDAKTPVTDKAQAINTKPPLTYIKRTGGYRIDTITPEEIVDRFGFSAVNYGQYVNDKWSKELTKHFLGSICDLGEMLNIDIKAVNALGHLAIAFGAKGHAGHLATYYPQTKDINLTRGKGDGSVAHEWGHYFDNVIVDGSARTAEPRFASENPSSLDINEFKGELHDMYRKLMNFIHKGDEGITPKLPVTFYARKSDVPLQYYKPMVSYGRSELVELEILETIEETLAQDVFKNLCVIPDDLKSDSRYKNKIAMIGHVIYSFGLESYDVPMKLQTSYYFHKSAYRDFDYCFKDGNDIYPKYALRTKYWVKSVELFARAWETVVLKKLMDRSRVSNFLVNSIPMDNVILESYQEPYPQDEELEYIELLIDAIIAYFKEKYHIGNFVAPSTIRQDEFIDLKKDDIGETESAVVIATTSKGDEVVTLTNDEGDKKVIVQENTRADIEGAIEVLQLLADDGDTEAAGAIETLKLLLEDIPEASAPETMEKGGKVPEFVAKDEFNRYFEYVPLKEIAPYIEHDRETEHKWDKDYLDKFTKKVAKTGITHPITLQIDEGKGLITEGNHRIASAKRLGIEHVPVQVYYHAFGSINKHKAKRLPDIWPAEQRRRMNEVGTANSAYANGFSKYDMFADGGEIKLLAPNGRQSNLTSEQYALVRTPAFISWFGDWLNDPANASKVVDDNGEPLVVHHGTYRQYNVFENTRDTGWYFTDSKRIADIYANYVRDGKLFNADLSKGTPRVITVFLNIRNIFKIKMYGMIAGKNKTLITKNKKKGADGLLLIGAQDVGGYYDQYVAFYPEQIKLADGTNTTFDCANPDIRFADGGEIKMTTYKKRVEHNLKQMSAPSEEWSAVPIIGEQETEVNGKERKMPIFDFPKGYTTAPTIFPSAKEPPYNCELCGKQPISTVYHIKNDTKKWVMAVGSECVTHFGEGISGKAQQREFKIQAAKILDADLCNIRKVIYENFSRVENIGHGKKGRSWKASYIGSAKDTGLFKDIYDAMVVINPTLLVSKNYPSHIYWHEIRKQIPAFYYASEMGTANGNYVATVDKEAASKSVDRRILSWYTKNKDIAIAYLQQLIPVLNILLKDKSVVVTSDYLDSISESTNT